MNTAMGKKKNYYFTKINCFLEELSKISLKNKNTFKKIKP